MSVCLGACMYCIFMCLPIVCVCVCALFCVCICVCLPECLCACLHVLHFYCVISVPGSALERPEGVSEQDYASIEEFQQRTNAVALERVKAYYRKLR